MEPGPVTDEDPVVRWSATWERTRQRLVRQERVLPEWRAKMPDAALAILDEVRALAEIADPAVHAAAPVTQFVERVNQIDGPTPIWLHGPVCSDVCMLQLAASELLLARSGESSAEAAAAAADPGHDGPGGRGTPRPYTAFQWLLMAGVDEVVVGLVEEWASSLAAPLPVLVADTREAALERVTRRGECGIVVTNLTLRGSGGASAHGLEVATEARRRRHAALVLTAAADYIGYWPRLAGAGLTGHDVVIKTRRDFAARLRQRIREIAEPAALGVSYDEDTGHVMWIGDVQVAELEGQEALVLRALDDDWRSAQLVADACASTKLGPTPGSVPPLISTLRTKIMRALVEAESPYAQREVIQSRRRENWPTQYRLASWLRWQDPPEPGGAARELPPVLAIDDDLVWAEWVAGWLREWGWPATAFSTPDALRSALAGSAAPGSPRNRGGGVRISRGGSPVLVADLALRDPARGEPDPEIGLRLVEEVSLGWPGTRVIVLSAFGYRDSVRARLFEAGVRTVDVIDKAGGWNECAAMLLASLHRATDEMRRGVRLAGVRAPLHRVVRRERCLIEVDGRPVARLTEREAAIVDELVNRAGIPVKADYLEAACFPVSTRARTGAAYNPLNKVHSTVARLRRKIDAACGRPRVGESVVRTPHMGARTTYELHGIVRDLSQV
jgi:DNA-binding response OmpR family regulator/CheY-like chemotaxis protein